MVVMVADWAATGAAIVSHPFLDGNIIATVDLLDSLAISEDVDGWHGLNAHLVGQLAQLVHIDVDEVVVLVASGEVLEDWPKVDAITAPFDREQTNDRFGLLVLQVELKLTC